MATLFDIGLIESGSSLFAFILVLVISYALLIKIDFFGFSKFNATVVAICFSMLTLFTPAILNTVKIVTPWFGILGGFVLFVLVALFTLGYTQADLSKTLASKDYGMQIKVWIIVIAAIIFIAALSSQFSVFTGESDTSQNQVSDSGQATVTGSSPSQSNSDGVAGKGEDALIATLFHPKMLSMIAIMLIAVFASIFLSTSNKV